MVAWDGNVYLYCNVYFGRQCRIRVQRSTALFNYGQESFRGQFSGISACAYCPVFCIHSQLSSFFMWPHLECSHFSHEIYPFLNEYIYLLVCLFFQPNKNYLSLFSRSFSTAQTIYTLFLKLYFKNIISGRMTICIQ